jgi:uncharacterized damage-inducible protein DinB
MMRGKKMVTSNKLIELFERTHWVMVRQTEGLTHADSLLQLPFRGNCLNWILGHIMVGRDKVLQALDEAPLFEEAEGSRYQRGADPITGVESAISLERLLEALEESQERITTALKEAADESLDALVDVEKERTIRDRIEFLHWHETYHTGQLEILRQLSGVDDAVIR